MNIYALFALLNGFVARLMAPLRDGYWLLALIIGATASLFVLSIQDLPDVLAYQRIFENTPALWTIITDPSVLTAVYGEPGYLVLGSIFRVFSDDYGLFRFVAVFSSLALKLWVIRRVSPNVGFAVFLYFGLFFYFDSFVLRQALAASLMGVGLYALFEGRRGWFLCWALFAATVHVSALCVLPLYFLVRFDPGRLFALVVVAFALVLGVVNAGSVIIDLVINYSGIEYIATKLKNYKTSVHAESLGLLRGSTLLYTAALVAFAAMRPWLRDRLKYYPQILVVCLYAYLIFVGFNTFGILGDRLFRLFGLFYCVAVASFSLCIEKEDRLVFAVCIVPVAVLAMMFMAPDLVIGGF